MMRPLDPGQPWPNTTIWQDKDFLRCWKHQECSRCLGERECSWCPYSWACVPNHASVAVAAPIWSPLMCPLADERWELRTSTLGCRVSTITAASTIGSAGILLSLAFVASGLRMLLLRLQTARRHPGWWRVGGDGGNDGMDVLLSATRVFMKGVIRVLRWRRGLPPDQPNPRIRILAAEEGQGAHRNVVVEYHEDNEVDSQHRDDQDQEDQDQEDQDQGNRDDQERQPLLPNGG